MNVTFNRSCRLSVGTLWLTIHLTSRGLLKPISAKWLLSDTFPLLVTSSLQHFRDTKKLGSTRLCKTALHENNCLELENFFSLLCYCCPLRCRMAKKYIRKCRNESWNIIGNSLLRMTVEIQSDNAIFFYVLFSPWIVQLQSDILAHEVQSA